MWYTDFAVRETSGGSLTTPKYFGYRRNQISDKIQINVAFRHSLRARNHVEQP